MKAPKRRYWITLCVTVFLFAFYQFYFLGTYFNHIRYGDTHEILEIQEYIENYYVDKIDRKQDYTFDNSRLVATHINFVKNHSIDETQLQEWIAHIRSIGEDAIRANCKPYILK